ncbi:MAG: 50S ribosomal protein L17 [Ignavibacteria bacterium]|nr:50S ribosomal protein L17 [Ignavibacteria bacterium]
MRHGYAGRKLKRTASHKKAMMSNMATSLFEHKRLITTVAKAKELRPFAEHLITRARNAHNSERVASAVLDVHSRRMVGRFIKNKAVLQELFDTIAPLVAERNGGYTRIVKLGIRRGDNAPEALIELVDWSNPQDGRVSAKTRKKPTTVKPKPRAAKKAAPVAEVAAPVDEAPEIEEKIVDVAEATIDTPTPDAPETDAPAEDGGSDAAADQEDKA